MRSRYTFKAATVSRVQCSEKHFYSTDIHKRYHHLLLSNVLKKKRSVVAALFSECCVLLHFSQRGEDEGAEPRAAHRDASREGALLLEVDGDADDGGEVDEAEAEAGQHADGEVEHHDGGGGHGERHARRGEDGAAYGDQPAPVPVGEVARYGT